MKLLLPGYLMLGEITPSFIGCQENARTALAFKSLFPPHPPCGIIPAHLFSLLAFEWRIL
jgi:hypothetical protein